MMLSAPTATTKPEAETQVPGDADATVSFQSVLDQETSQHPGSPETVTVQVQDPELDSDETVEELVVSEITAEPDRPPAEKHLIAPDVIAPETAEIQTEVQPDKAAAPETAVNLAESIRTLLRDGPIQPSDPPAQRVFPPAFHALAVGAASFRTASEGHVEPQEKPTVVSVVKAKPAETAEMVAAVEPKRDGLSVAPASQPMPKQPARPESAPNLVQMQLLASEVTSAQAETVSIPDPEDTSAPRELPGIAPTREAAGTTQALTATARAETARAVANQMATVITARPQSGMVEVALNPEELGRVSIILNGRDDGLHMTISAERAETLDMMRRHLSVLEAEFQSLGLGDLSFDLGTPSDAEQDGSNPDDDARLSPSHPEQIAEVDPALPQIGPDGRIDIRL